MIRAKIREIVGAIPTRMYSMLPRGISWQMICASDDQCGSTLYRLFYNMRMLSGF